MSIMENGSDPLEGPSETAAKQSLLRKLLPVGIVAILLVTFFATGLHQYFTVEALAENRDTLRGFVDENFLIAGLAFITIYALAVAISFPGAAFLTIASGFLFGTLAGGAFAVLGAGTGAVAIFVIARSALSDLVAAKAGPFVEKMRKGFEENELSYMFFLRFVPGFPFWVVNVVPAVLGVKLRIYVIATFIGIIPGGFVYASIGTAVDTLIASGQDVDLGSLVTQPAVIAPFVGLALLSLVPVIWRKIAGPKSDITE